MPFWQREVVRDSVSMTFAQTYELDLPKTGQLGSLLLYVRSTQNAAPFLTAVKWRLIDYISKVEVIGNGSEVIKSFDGRQALASAFYDDGRVPSGIWRHYSNTPHRQVIPINFGRWIRDQIYGLDLSKWDQVTLKVTNDATATEFTTDITVTVEAEWMREGGAFSGYMREEEWKVWAPAAGVTEYSDLPTGRPIRRILLRARPGVDTADALNNSSMDRVMGDIDFSFNTGQVRVYKGSMEELRYMLAAEGGIDVETEGMIDRTSDYGFETGVGYVLTGQKAVASYTAAPATFPATIGVPDVQDSSQQSQQRVADAPLEWHVRGHGFMHNLPIWEAKDPTLADMLDPDGRKVVKLDIQCQSGTTVSGTHHAAESAIVLSRLVA